MNKRKNSTPVQLRLDTDDLNTLSAISDLEDVTINSIIRKVIKQFLATHNLNN
jgi:hypothetical protein